MFYFPPLLDPPPLLDLDEPLELPDDDLLGLILPLELLLLDDPESQLLLEEPELLLLGVEDLFTSGVDLFGVVVLDGEDCLVSELGLLLSVGCVLVVFGLVLFTSLLGDLVVDSDLL